jgi:hypothetical protein
MDLGGSVKALQKIYESVKDRLPFGFEQFAENVKDWEILPVMHRGELIGGVMIKGNELHVGFAKKPKASIRGNIKEVMLPLLEKHGFVITYVSKNNLNGLKFCKRLGFVELSQESDRILLRCDRSNYV